MRIPCFGTLILGLALATSATAQTPPVPAVSGYSYADLADRALSASVAAVGRITSAAKLKPAQAADLRSGFARFYVEAELDKLIFGGQELSSRVTYLVDVPLDAKGRAPKLKKQRVVILAKRVAGRPSELQLVSPDAQLPWSEATEHRLRVILVAANDPGAPPRITGVGKAFHVPGSLPGESETQIFLTTAGGRPVSLSVLRRPAEEPSWAVALGEMVDEAAAAPPRDTLLWYRLACTLPPALPRRSLADLDAAAAAAAAADYALVLEGLGPCGRTAN